MWQLVFALAVALTTPLATGNAPEQAGLNGATADGAKLDGVPPESKGSAALPNTVAASDTPDSAPKNGDTKAGTPTTGAKEKSSVANASTPPDNDLLSGTDNSPGDQRSGWSKAVAEILDSGAIGELRRGGFFMWPILALAIVAAGVVLERWRSLKMVGTDTREIRGKVAELLESDRVEDALATCDAQQGPVPYVLAVGLRKYLVLRRLGYDPAQVSDQVVRVMDDHSVHIVAALERHLPILATVSSVAPMLGFLGTVQGMVVSFREIVARMGETNIVEAAATGINIALLTTVFGLIVGIPTYIAYNYFTSVINGYVLQVEESASELIDAVTMKMALEIDDQGTPG